jgi:hypothetical protein
MGSDLDLVGRWASGFLTVPSRLPINFFAFILVGKGNHGQLPAPAMSLKNGPWAWFTSLSRVLQPGKWMELENIILSEAPKDKRQKIVCSASYVDIRSRANTTRGLDFDHMIR